MAEETYIIADRSEHEAQARSAALLAVLREAKTADRPTRRELFALAVGQALTVAALLEGLLRRDDRGKVA